MEIGRGGMTGTVVVSGKGAVMGARRIVRGGAFVGRVGEGGEGVVVGEGDVGEGGEEGDVHGVREDDGP